MIKDIVVGDITAPGNHAHIIIGMNTTLEDVTGIGLPFVRDIKTKNPIALGSVLSFHFSPERSVHMLICHDIGYGGWANADKHIRFGMDYLWKTSNESELPPQEFSIVQIGTGKIGLRDGADASAIRTAIANSHLPVTLYVFDQGVGTRELRSEIAALRAYRAWDPIHGEEQLVS